MIQRPYTLQDKKMLVVGLGKTGQSCVSFLQHKGAMVTAIDSRDTLPDEATASLPDGVDVHLGSFDFAHLQHQDIIVISPGVSRKEPAIARAIQSGIPVVGDIEVFAWYNTLPVIAITGSNGKTTVTSLVAEMLAESGHQVLTGGNIGTPALELLDQDAEIIVLELSSFQLESTYSLIPTAACVLNLSEDHMDRYASLEDYRDAKLRIYENAEHRLYNRDDKGTWSTTMPDTTFGLSPTDEGMSYDQTHQELLWDNKPFFSVAHSHLVGIHNVLNIQAACILAYWGGADRESIEITALRFRSLPHRCELIAQSRGVRWINDSKATNVGATTSAIRGLRPVTGGKLILIAGGDSKGADLSPLQDTFAHDVDHLIVLGKDATALAALAREADRVDSLEQAVALAHELANRGDTVLLSPACASLDMFTDFSHRGEVFAAAVREVLNEH